MHPIPLAFAAHILYDKGRRRARGKRRFTSQFAGVESADGVDTITGATISSTAVKDAVNQAISNLQTVKEAG